jgi:PAS domain S-box-containing protein
MAACRVALSDAEDILGILAALTRQEPAQAQRVAAIEARVAPRLGFVRGVLSAKSAGSDARVRSLLADDAGGAALREIQRSIERLKNDELALLTERDTASYLQAQAMRYTVWAGVALDVLLLAASAWLIGDDIAARRRLAGALQEANAALEAKVADRTRELAAANTALTNENMERAWANQALEHQLRYNNLIIDSIHDLVFVLTRATNISRLNPAVTAHTGFTAAELVGLALSRVIELEQGSALVDPLAQALGTGRELANLPAKILDRKGNRIPALFSMVPLRDRDKVVGAVVTVQPAGARP